MAENRLNLGCGTDIREGWVNIDAQPRPGVDLILDLEGGKLPFESDSVDEVYCAHVLEHIWEWEKVVLEVFRVLKPGGRFELRVPNGLVPCAYHVRTFVKWTMDWFIEGMGEGENTSHEPGTRFKLIRRGYGRKFPLYWHIRHYLKIPVPFNFKFGKVWEIYWILEKPRESGFCDKLILELG